MRVLSLPPALWEWVKVALVVMAPSSCRVRLCSDRLGNRQAQETVHLFPGKCGLGKQGMGLEDPLAGRQRGLNPPGLSWAIPRNGSTGGHQ